MNDPNAEIPKQACNALDAILEGLDDEILHYLPTLMERLLLLLDNGPSEVKATVTAAIGSAAHASGSVSFFIFIIFSDDVKLIFLFYLISCFNLGI
jgi:hypothetical protein